MRVNENHIFNNILSLLCSFDIESETNEIEEDKARVRFVYVSCSFFISLEISFLHPRNNN